VAAGVKLKVDMDSIENGRLSDQKEPQNETQMFGKIFGITRNF
jgi:hypothetical protein